MPQAQLLPFCSHDLALSSDYYTTTYGRTNSFYSAAAPTSRTALLPPRSLSNRAGHAGIAWLLACGAGSSQMETVKSECAVSLRYGHGPLIGLTALRTLTSA